MIETYALDVLEGAKGDVFDRSPPPELELENSVLPAWLRRKYSVVMSDPSFGIVL